MKLLVAFLFSLGNFLFFQCFGWFLLGLFLCILSLTHNDLQWGAAPLHLCTFYSVFPRLSAVFKCVILSIIRSTTPASALGNRYNSAFVTPTASGSRKESTVMIIVSEVSKGFGTRTLFDNVSVKFSPGNRYGLTGPNGAGKSTFMKILSGQVEASNRGNYIQTI